MFSTDTIVNVITMMLAFASGNIYFASLLVSWIASDTYIFGFMTILQALWKEFLYFILQRKKPRLCSVVL